MSRRRVALVIGSPAHLDQMIFHGALEELVRRLDVTLIVPSGADMSEVEGAMTSAGLNPEVLRYGPDPRASRAADRLTRAMTFRFRGLSTGYHARFTNAVLGYLDIPMEPRTARIAQVLRRSGPVLRRLAREAPTMFRGSALIYAIYRHLAYRRIVAWRDLQATLTAVSPDCVLVVMQRQQAFVIASLHWAATSGIPSVLVPLKWDNATSKSPLLDKPSRMAVYNHQSAQECAQLHDMPASSVVQVGSPETPGSSYPTAPTQRRQILAAGSVADCRMSAHWLTALARVIRERGRGSLNPVAVTWRPYPTRQPEYLDLMSAFVTAHPQITLDPVMSAQRSHRHAGVPIADRLAAYNDYRSQLASVDLVVSETTSLVIDARSHGVPVIVPAFRARATFGSQWHHLNGFEHLRGLRTTNGVFIAETEEDFVRLVNDFLDNPRRIPPDNSGEHIFVDDRTYAERLIDVIEDAIAEKDRERASATV